MGQGTVIVTGGAGYIGSQTIIELMERTGFDVLSIDSHINSSASAYNRIQAITGRRVAAVPADLCDAQATSDAFAEASDPVGVIHFAALKSVPESVRDPGLYYRNNISSLLHVLLAMRRFQIPNLIFSSSCSVYGNVSDLPVSEETPWGRAESPYAFTKQVGERIVEDHAMAWPWLKAISLRYFNPVGAHISGLNGEDPVNPPTNLVPIITANGMRRLNEFIVHGSDYPTRDGSCIRDYVHVSDVASAHVNALELLINGNGAQRTSVYNLGTGQGVSVLEAIEAFEKVTGVKLNYRIGPRRAGDVIAIYSDTRRSAKGLNWAPRYGIDEMMSSAWAWELRQHGKSGRSK